MPTIYRLIFYFVGLHRLDRDFRRGGAKEGRGNDRDQASGRRGRNLGGSENSGSQIQEGKKMSHSLRRKVFFLLQLLSRGFSDKSLSNAILFIDI